MSGWCSSSTGCQFGVGEGSERGGADREGVDLVVPWATWHGAVWLTAGKIAGSEPRSPIVGNSAFLGGRGQIFLAPEEPRVASRFPQDAAVAVLVLLLLWELVTAGLGSKSLHANVVAHSPGVGYGTSCKGFLCAGGLRVKGSLVSQWVNTDLEQLYC